MHRPLSSIHCILVLLAAALAPSAQAYLDPGSGSMILQLLLGGVAGVAVILKLYWHKLLALFGVDKGGNDEPPA